MRIQELRETERSAWDLFQSTPYAGDDENARAESDRRYKAWSEASNALSLAKAQNRAARERVAKGK